MRILFVHERFGAFGGAEANIFATATEFKARGHAVGILHGPPTGNSEAAWLETFHHRFPLQHGDEPASAMEACAAFAPGAVYVHKISDLNVLELLLGSSLPIVRMVHDHDLYCMRSYKYNYFTRQICGRALSPYCVFPCGACVAHDHDGAFPLKWVSYLEKTRELELNRQCHRLIVATQFMKEELLRNRFDADRIEIHPPVPPNGEGSRHSSFSDSNIIMYAGQLIRGKGVDVLLDSLAKVKARFKCLIFGDGGYRTACEKLSRKLGLADRVFFKGFHSMDDMAIYYRRCSVAAVSSVWPEPFGAVGLEAMRFGLPIVAFDAGGIKEWLIDGHNGFLVPWMDRAAFAARLQDLLGNKQLARQMGDCGRRFAAAHFEFGKYITGLEELFSRVSDRPALAAA